MDCHLAAALKSLHRSILVIGYGNPLRSDDGVGQQIAKEVAAWGLPNVAAIAAAARLETELVPVVCYCATCQLEFQPTDLLYECPECHQPNCEVKQGQEFELAFLDVS